MPYRRHRRACRFVASLVVLIAGACLSSPPVHASSAVYVTADTTTQGNWKGAYGADGYNVINDPSINNPNYPSYATVSQSGQLSAVWTSASTAVSSLQAAAPGSSNRLLGVWYNTNSFVLNVNVTSGTHQFALYMLDWANAG